MYVACQAPSGMGAFSLKRALTPPRAIRDLVTQQLKGILHGTQVSVPTAGGTMTFDLSDPATWAQLRAMAAGIKLERKASPGPVDQVSAAVEKIPGGWLTIAAVGIGLFMVTRSRPPRAQRKRAA